MAYGAGVGRCAALSRRQPRPASDRHGERRGHRHLAALLGARTRPAAADRYARRLAVEFGPEWRRVLAPRRRSLARHRRPSRRSRVGRDRRSRHPLAPARRAGRSRPRGAGPRSARASAGTTGSTTCCASARRGPIRRGRARRRSPGCCRCRARTARASGTPPRTLIRRAARGERQARARCSIPSWARARWGWSRRAQGRRWIGVERDRHMAALAARRLRAASRQDARARIRRTSSP